MRGPAPYTMRAERRNVTVLGGRVSLPVMREMGTKAWVQDTPQREMTCMRVMNAATDAWWQLGREMGDNRVSFAGPVLAVLDDTLVIVCSEYCGNDEFYDPARVVAQLEKRGRSWHAVLAPETDPAEIAAQIKRQCGAAG